MNYTTRADTYYGNNYATNNFWNWLPDIRHTDSVHTGGYSRTIVTESGNRYTLAQPKYRFTYYRDTEEDLEDDELMDFLDGFRGTEYE